MIDLETSASIKQAFFRGELRVRTADPDDGEIHDLPCSDVLCHDSSNKILVRVCLSDGRSAVFTEDHSLFRPKGKGVIAVRAGDLVEGDQVVTVSKLSLTSAIVAKLEKLEPEEFTYDLSVPGPQNFMLSNGILAHNSYSIGGISLDIDRSSKYMDLKRNAEEQFDKATGAGGGEGVKGRTTKYLRGLQQPRFGRGIRSAFGPRVARGVLSPRSFI